MSRSWPTCASPTRAAPRSATSWCRLPCPASILIVTAYNHIGRQGGGRGCPARCDAVFFHLGWQQAEVALSDLGAALEAVIARTEIEAALKSNPSPGAGFQRFRLCRAAAADRGEEELQRQAGVSRRQRLSGGPNGEN